jgi:hypothetical protein
MDIETPDSNTIMNVQILKPFGQTDSREISACKSFGSLRGKTLPLYKYHGQLRKSNRLKIRLWLVDILKSTSTAKRQKANQISETQSCFYGAFM